MENLLFVKDKSIRVFIVLMHAPDSWQSKSSKKGNLFWFRSKFKLLFLSLRHFDFLYQNLNRKHSTYERVYGKRIILFFSCYSVLIVRNLEIENLNFNFSRCSNSYFTKTTGFSWSIRVGIENVLVLERLPVGQLSICVTWISGLTVQNFHEVLLFSHFAPCWNLSSSATTSSRSSNMDSVKKYKFVVEYWGEEPLIWFVASDFW